MTTEVELLAPDDASDEVLVEEVTRLVNAAYAAGEAGLWVEGAQRVTTKEIAEAIRGGGLLTASADGELVGCAYLRRLDAETADLSLISVDPERWGSGVGRELVRAAEELTRLSGGATMQLELLVPKEWVHPEKERLWGWYTRLGYEVVRVARFDEIAAQLAPQLATPCEFLIFRKALAAGV